MKNAFVLLKNGTGDINAEAVLSVFRAKGYGFLEGRILFHAEAKKLCDCVNSLNAEYENIVVLVDKAYLPFAKNALVALLGEGSFQGASSGLGLFVNKKNTLFLLSDDETGLAYANEVCVAYLEKKYALQTERTVIRAIGANPEHVQGLIATAKRIDGGAIKYEYTRKFDEDMIEMLYDANIPKRVADDVLRIFAEGMSDSIYALDDTPLEKQLVRLIKLRGRKISVAESFTGGGVAKRIVSVSGASAVYFEGLNTYDERSKQKRLGVSAYTLNTFGAVSDQTAYEMASGLIATGDCDISIATTGLAGPKSDRSALPVGLCYIAIGTKERVFVYRYKFDGTRKEITEKAINYALFLAYKQLKNL